MSVIRPSQTSYGLFASPANGRAQRGTERGAIVASATVVTRDSVSWGDWLETQLLNLLERQGLHKGILGMKQAKARYVVIV